MEGIKRDRPQKFNTEQAAKGMNEHSRALRGNDVLW